MSEKIIVNNNESNDKNDWRYMGQDAYLNEIALHYQKYAPTRPNWDHEHCQFCTAKISEYNGDINEGYCSEGGRYWICKKCFNDFAYMFKWKT